MEFSKKSLQFHRVQGSLNPNITFLGEKLWLVARNQKITSIIYGKNRKMPIKSVKMKISKNVPRSKAVAPEWTDGHESDYRGHPFRVSGIFPSTYHQGSAQ